MNLNNWSDKIVFSSLKLIKKGHLILTNYDDEKYLFGDPSQKLKVKITKIDRIEGSKSIIITQVKF